MKYVFGLLMIAWVAALQIIGQQTDIAAIASTLCAMCLFIVKEKFLGKLYASILYFIGAAVLAQYWSPFILLAAIPLLDFTYTKQYWLAALALAGAVAFSIIAGVYHLLPLLLLSAFTGYVLGVKDRNDEGSTRVLDEERRLRYNLEQAQNELINSRREIERLTEARERNRIAHELHDSIGHGIAGVLIQLEAAIRIHRKDADKTGEILKLCTGKLSETLTLTRNAVYNIRADVKTGVEALESIVDSFKFCPVDFNHSGDFSLVSSSNMRILEANMTEALTNAARHSHATEITIHIDIRRRNIRLCYKDNGTGCTDVREGLGLMGMRDRVRNAGGTIAIDGSDGFLIVCNLPEHSNDAESGERP